MMFSNMDWVEPEVGEAVKIFTELTTERKYAYFRKIALESACYMPVLKEKTEEELIYRYEAALSINSRCIPRPYWQKSAKNMLKDLREWIAA